MLSESFLELCIFPRISRTLCNFYSHSEPVSYNANLIFATTYSMAPEMLFPESKYISPVGSALFPSFHSRPTAKEFFQLVLFDFLSTQSLSRHSFPLARNSQRVAPSRSLLLHLRHRVHGSIWRGSHLSPTSHLLPRHLRLRRRQRLERNPPHHPQERPLHGIRHVLTDLLPRILAHAAQPCQP